MIEKFFFGLSSVLVIEGLMLALIPGRIKNAIKLIETTSASKLSFIGLLMMVLGIIFLSLIDI